MSSNQAVLIVSRAVSFYLICWVFTELTYVPSQVLDVVHHLGAQTRFEAHLRDIYVLQVVFLFVRIAFFSAAAIWFYSCGPRIQAFFLPEPDPTEGEQAHVRG